MNSEPPPAPPPPMPALPPADLSSQDQALRDAGFDPTAMTAADIVAAHDAGLIPPILTDVSTGERVTGLLRASDDGKAITYDLSERETGSPKMAVVLTPPMPAPPPTGSSTCPQRYTLRPCEWPDYRPPSVRSPRSVRHAMGLFSAMVGICVGAGVDPFSQPPRMGSR